MPRPHDHEPISPNRTSQQPSQRERSDFGRCSRTVLIVNAGLSLLLLIGMSVLDRALKTPEAPAGIISFELAGTLAGAEKIMGSWNGPARIQAGISLGLDFFFLIAYAYTLAAVCRMVAARLTLRWLPLGRLGTFLAGGAWCAACLDLVENMALIQLLIGNGERWHAAVAAVCAWLKFSLILAVLAYIFLGAAWVLWSRPDH